MQDTHCYLVCLTDLKPKRLPYPVYEPLVTLLIAAYNEEFSIVQKLENSLALNYPREKLQIIVAADGSNDGTPDLVKEFFDQGYRIKL